jgi:hypothetical protein
VRTISCGGGSAADDGGVPSPAAMKARTVLPPGWLLAGGPALQTSERQARHGGRADRAGLVETGFQVQAIAAKERMPSDGRLRHYWAQKSASPLAGHSRRRAPSASKRSAACQPTPGHGPALRRGAAKLPEPPRAADRSEAISWRSAPVRLSAPAQTRRSPPRQAAPPRLVMNRTWRSRRLGNRL